MWAEASAVAKAWRPSSLVPFWSSKGPYQGYSLEYIIGIYNMYTGSMIYGSTYMCVYIYVCIFNISCAEVSQLYL